MRVLVLNPGSSSLKSSVVEAATAEFAARPATAPAAGAAVAPLAKVDVDWGVDATSDSDPADDIRGLLRRYEAAGIETASLGAVGYRVVHGGERFREPVLVTPEVIEEVDALRSLAPLHNGIAVATMKAGLAAIPQLPQVAVFDTAFHATLPEDAYRYPVPERWYREWGVRRYGFHGMSVEWSAERAAQLLARPAGEIRLVVAHLGSGCSVTAVDGGSSAATSMGLTPLEGLMMGTRSGSIDPGILFYLRRNGWLTDDELADQLDHQSGLVGVSGRTSDVRELLQLEAAGDKPATLALRVFVRRAAECIAAAATSLHALDAIVFTGGIGENAAGLRARIVARLVSIGVAPIADAPAPQDAVISSPGVSPAILRIEAREDLVVARAAVGLVEAGGPADQARRDRLQLPGELGEGANERLPRGE
jgi:acetate kinase